MIIDRDMRHISALESVHADQIKDNSDMKKLYTIMIVIFQRLLYGVRCESLKTVQDNEEGNREKKCYDQGPESL